LTFKPDQFISDCISAVSNDHEERVIRELLTDAMADTQSVRQALGEPRRAEIQKMYVSDSLTVINVIWAPGMTLMPHNHNMWAIIGVYAGREDNIFWRRVEGNEQGLIEAAGARSLGPGDVQPLGRNIIHSVTNPTSIFTGAIHVYGGDFFATERSEWDPEALQEHPYDIEKNLRKFEDANED
jgi:predicted metal-dependent enzyme (double-stranded beta helix superfamily)